MNPTGSYQFENLESREKEAIFLSERAKLRLDGFKDLLLRHNIPTKGKALEVGSAQGIRSHLIAQNFSNLQVVGVDRSLELLSEAQTLHKNQSNLSFQEADLYELPFSDESFDFVYARLVFMHLKDPMRALESLKRVLRPGGRILIEDADRDCMFFEPAPNSFSDFWSKVQAGQRRLGGDPNVGRKLAPYLKEKLFRNLNIEVQTILGEGPEIEFLVRTLLPSLNIYLEAQDRQIGEAAIRDLLAMSKAANASFYHFWFAVSGEK